MSPGPLTPEEVASLLGSSSDGGRADTPRATGSATATMSLRTRLQNIGARHARIDAELAAALETSVRDPVSVRWLDCETLPFGQLLWTMPPPTCLGCGLANGEPLALHVDLHLLFSLLDRLLNGLGSLPPDLRRPLTEVEQRLALRILRPLAEVWETVWSTALPNAFLVEKVLSHPQRLHAWTPETQLVVNRYRVTVENVAGQIQLVAPLAAMTAWLDGASNGTAARSSASGGRLPPGTTPREWTIQLAEQRLSASDVESLQVGDLLATDHPLAHPLVARAESGETTVVRVGLVDGQQVVRRAEG